MNKIKCFDCGFSWLISHEDNGHALQHACPRCGSNKVQYLPDRRLLVDIPGMNSTISGIPSGLGNGFRFQEWMTK